MLSGIIGLIFAICYLIATLVIISAFIEIAREKNPEIKVGVFYFVGIFTTPITIGLYVLAMQKK